MTNSIPRISHRYIGLASMYLKATPIRLKAIMVNIPEREIPFEEITILSLSRLREEKDTSNATLEDRKHSLHVASKRRN